MKRNPPNRKTVVVLEVPHEDVEQLRENTTWKVLENVPAKRTPVEQMEAEFDELREQLGLVITLSSKG